MKFLIVGDLHGQMPKIKFKDFDAIIAPGDFCSDATKKYIFQEVQQALADPASKKRWYDLLGRKEAKKMIKKSLADGRKVLEFLNSVGKPAFLVPGNWDWTPLKDDPWTFFQEDHYKELTRGLDNIHDLHLKKTKINNITIIGHGITHGPELPQYEDDLEMWKGRGIYEKAKKNYTKKRKKLNKLFTEEIGPIIFLSHNVPFNTKIDSIVNPNSPRNGRHYGSLIAREMVDEYQPLLCIGGHMHEHFASCKIGKTTCINAGFGGEVNVLLEITKGKIVQLEFRKE